MDKGRGLLSKLGWKAGEGLGKNKEGISRAVSVGFKNDCKGVGSVATETFSWWDHVFNKATASIQVKKDDSGEILVAMEKKPNPISAAIVGSFVKGGDSSGGSPLVEDFSSKVTDEELFAACEGRTARKGARFDQNGKLSRVMKPRIPDRDNSDNQADNAESLAVGVKELQKRKRENDGDKEQEQEVVLKAVSSKSGDLSLDDGASQMQSKSGDLRSKKKKKKQDDGDTEALLESGEMCSTKKTKKTKKKNKSPEDEHKQFERESGGKKI